MPKKSADPIVVLLQTNLLAWFGREARDLPWRRTRDPYAVWVSEIMLQQTRVDQTKPYYERFLSAFPTVRSLAAAAEDDVLKRWEGLGYYTRARNLHKAAKVIVAECGGALPETADAWGRLPGVGPYTAGAIASIAFGEQTPVLDGNVKRVLSRLFDIHDCIDQPRTVTRLWDIARTLVPAHAPGDMNQALMELGARLCTPKAPQCTRCPVSSACAARSRGVQEDLPVRREKKPVPHRELVAAVIARSGRYLIGKRPTEGLLGGLWEFPNDPVAPGESHRDALIRIAKVKTGLDVTVRGLVATVNHAYTHFRITINAYRCEPSEAAPISAYYTTLRWVRPTHFARYAFPKAHHKILALL